MRSKHARRRHGRSADKIRSTGLSGHLHGSPEKGFAMRARGRTQVVLKSFRKRPMHLQYADKRVLRGVTRSKVRKARDIVGRLIKRVRWGILGISTVPLKRVLL